jgi:hypothetical protein
MRHYMGIDPGVNGAIVVINDVGQLLCCHDIPTYSPKAGSSAKRIDLTALWAIFTGFRVEYMFKPEDTLFATLEQMPTAVESKQGAMATIAKGRNEAYCEMSLAIAEIPYQKVYPVSWKAGLNLGKDKKVVVQDAIARWPSHQQLFRGPRGGLFHDRAEAALLAEYGRRCG